MSKLSRRRKPGKPHRSFPLTAHNNGQWCKKIRGKIHFFGVWDDPKAAHDHYLLVAADLHAGRQPQQATLSPDTVTVKDLCNHYLTHQLHKVESAGIGPRWLEDGRRVLKVFASFTGSHRPVSDLRPDDFERFRLRLVKKGLSGKKGLGVHALGRAITVVKATFKHGYDTDLLDRPMKYGTGFGKPSATLKRKARHVSDLENGKKLFGPPDIVAMLKDAQMPLRAMILLAINGGMGNTDCANLPTPAIDWERGLVDFHRPKTGIARVVPLWPETIQALQQALAERPKPADDAASKLVFLTIFGRPWVRENVHESPDSGVKKVVPMDAIGLEFRKLMTKLGLKRKGIGFYALRHTFRTWADEVPDQHAIHRIMGHTIPGMSGIYVEEIELPRLRAVVDHVRAKLFGDSTPDAAPPEPT